MYYNKEMTSPIFVRIVKYMSRIQVLGDPSSIIPQRSEQVIF